MAENETRAPVVKSAAKRTTTRRSAPRANGKSILDDKRFQFGQPPIRTAEDAVSEFLRGQITEDELVQACALYGRDPADILNPVRPTLERPDAGFAVDIPEEVFAHARNPKDTFANRQTLVEDKEALREDATKQAERDKDEKETQKREASADFRNKLAKKHLTPSDKLPD